MSESKAGELLRRLEYAAKGKPYSFLGPEIDLCKEVVAELAAMRGRVESRDKEVSDLRETMSTIRELVRSGKVTGINRDFQEELITVSGSLRPGMAVGDAIRLANSHNTSPNPYPSFTTVGISSLCSFCNKTLSEHGLNAECPPTPEREG